MNTTQRTTKPRTTTQVLANGITADGRSWMKWQEASGMIRTTNAWTRESESADISRYATSLRKSFVFVAPAVTMAKAAA